MRSIRTIQMGVLLIAVVAVAGVSAALAAKDNANDIYPEVFSVCDLPVWRLDGDRPVFDASVVVALIESSVAPKSWDGNGGDASIAECADKLSLVVCQTQENQGLIMDLLKQLRASRQPIKSPSP